MQEGPATPARPYAGHWSTEPATGESVIASPAPRSAAIGYDVVDTKATRLIRRGIWVYFLLLIFEGALRKWVLPGLATPLLVVRDPIVLVLVLAALRNGLMPASNYLVASLGLGVISLLTALSFGHGSILVALYGARPLLINVPLMLVIGRTMSPHHVVRMGRLTLAIAVPMALLIVLQFYSPQSAWVNRGVGGDLEGAGFSGAMGYFRPPGTFSFTNGTSSFFGFVGAFVGYFWFRPKEIGSRLLLAGTIALLAAIPFSISRTLFFQTMLVGVFAFMLTLVRTEYGRRAPKLIVSVALVFTVLAATPLFSRAVDVLSTRFTHAAQVEGGLGGTLGERFIGGMASAITKDYAGGRVFGYGTGLGTQVGAKLATGQRGYLIAEGEWQRTVGELGLLLGVLVILLRSCMTADLLYQAYRKASVGLPLGWMLMSFSALQILQGNLGQPTELGFVTVSTGITIAAFRWPPPSRSAAAYSV